MSQAQREQQRRLLLAEVSRILPGLYSWAATVLLPVAQRGAPLGARLFAAVAFAALVAAYLMFSKQGRLARWLGVYTFILACFLSWALLGASLRSEQLDPVRGALGAIGFLLHALAWGAEPRVADEQPLDNLVPGSPLQPRHHPVRAAPAVFGAGIVLALLPMAMAFGVQRPGASLLAHTLGLGCALLLVAASIDVALRVGKPQTFPAWRARASRAVWPLGALTFALGIGLIWLALR